MSNKSSFFSSSHGFWLFNQFSELFSNKVIFKHSLKLSRISLCLNNFPPSSSTCHFPTLLDNYCKVEKCPTGSNHHTSSPSSAMERSLTHEPRKTKGPVSHCCFRCANPGSSSLLQTEFHLFMGTQFVFLWPPVSEVTMLRPRDGLVLTQHSSWHQKASKAYQHLLPWLHYNPKKWVKCWHCM